MGQDFEHKKTFDFQTLAEIVNWAKFYADISKFRFYTVFGNGYEGAQQRLVLQDIINYAEEEYDRGAEANTGYGIY